MEKSLAGADERRTVLYTGMPDQHATSARVYLSKVPTQLEPVAAPNRLFLFKEGNRSAKFMRCAAGNYSVSTNIGAICVRNVELAYAHRPPGQPAYGR
jgi:hypothetical protein